jgi:predicted esterase
MTSYFGVGRDARGGAARAILLLLLASCQGKGTPTRPPAPPSRAVSAPSERPSPHVGPPPISTTTAAGEGARVVPRELEPVLVTWPPAPPTGLVNDFCIEAVHALDSEACYVLPDAPTRELLLYLHGIVPPAKVSAQKTNFETVVANASRRAGVAALMPRGERGLAPKGRSDWWGWPTSLGSYAELAPKLVARFEEQRSKLEALTGRRFERLYIAGSSSGAYFATLLALNGHVSADAFGAMSGGSAAPGADFSRASPTRFYIGYGRHDTVGPAAELLGSRLRSAGWAVRVSAHPVSHGAKEVYLDEAFEFWRLGGSE